MKKSTKLSYQGREEGDHVDVNTGEVTEAALNKILIVESERPSTGKLPRTRRIQFDYQYCPSLAEQHTGHLTDINYLMERYKPDELAAYLAARNLNRPEIVGHDFSKEPDLQGAKNVVYQSKQAFEALDDDVKKNFRNHLEFLKFIDNPANAEKLIKLGLATRKELAEIQIPDPNTATIQTRTTPAEDKDKE